MAKSEKNIKVKPSKNFLHGSCSVRHILGAERSFAFHKDETISVSAEELDCLQGYGWVEIVSTPPQKEVSDGN
jgi:hypothetical protein